VDHKERIESVERRYSDVEEEVHQVNSSAYRGRVELEEWVERLEEVNAELWSRLHRSIAESQRLMRRVSELNQQLARFIHGQGNPIVVEDSPEPDPLRLPQLPEGHPHHLVPIEDLAGSLDRESLESQSIFDEDREVVETMVTSWEVSPEL
jgi:uncharacterized protein YhaN